MSIQRADTTAPGAPASLIATVVAGPAVEVSWQASTDDTAVAGYRIYRDGSPLASVSGLSFTDNSVIAGSQHTYEVTASDPSGNTSLPSARATVVVPVPTTSGFIARSGSLLTLDGKKFQFNGLNIYSAYKMDLDSALTKIGSGQEVFRAFFYQHMATVNGERDWTALDRVVRIAGSHGMKVIPVLTDQWGASTDGPEKFLPWWPAPYGGDGYRSTKWKSTDLVPYRDWVVEVVSRYADSPTVAFWQLINEGEARNADGTFSEVNSRNAIRAFADDMGNLVKGLDPNHLVSLGTIAGEAGSNEADYQYVHDSSGIDIADYHDYQYPYSAMGNTDSYNGLQTSITRIKALNKVIMVGEMGIHWTRLDLATLARRAQLFDQKSAAQFAAGAAGSLMWCWNDPASATWDYEIGSADPSLALLDKY